MAEGILYGIAQEILKNLGSSVLNEIASAWGFKERLEMLKRSVNTIKNVLLDAEEKQAAADGHAVRGWLEELATVIYAADDLFDEFNTIASRQKLLGGNKVSRKVRTFFSTSNQIAFAFKLSRKIKLIRERLEAIKEDGDKLGLAQRTLQPGSATSPSRETHSHVDEDEVIGRDDDKKAILDRLLASGSIENDQDCQVLQVLPIVGIGGMGKTTLAQLIYNDPQVMDYFELRLWVCVAEDFNIKVTIEKIIRSATNTETPKLDIEQLQSLLRKEVDGKKYLLVLDDVWEEDPRKWGKLKPLLKNGKNGSKIIVTTRLRKVAEIMGTFPPHELHVLSEEKSWHLFEKMAFRSGEAQEKPELMKVGQELVKKCANVPLAIVSLGRLLRFEDKSRWMSFKDKNLSEVMDVLKLSYQHLQSPLKNCFAYCALFPKDYEFVKETMIELWMAQGFVIPSVDRDRSLEDIAEDYFVNLVQRSFFQDVRRNEWEDITSCKMHDLMHDLAQQVATGKCKVVDGRQNDFEDRILHLSFTGEFPPSWEISNHLLNLKLLRTIIYGGFDFGFKESACLQVVTNFRHLRVLDLRNLWFQTLPNSIGKLIHLRYLNLCWTKIETLPDSITNLYNLQTLNLSFCDQLKTLPKDIQKLANLRSLNFCNCAGLKTLPKDIKKLANLRSLDIRGCDGITYMPSGIGGLTLLHKLPIFIVSHKQSVESMKKPKSIAKLSDLKKLNNLRGELSIHVHSSCYGDNKLEEMEEDIIINKHDLTSLNVRFDWDVTCEADRKKHDDAVLEGLKPHSNLRRLDINHYRGEKLASWAVTDNLGKTLPNLVEVKLWRCRNCQQLPCFSQLQFLKRLELYDMESVVYVESYTSPSSRSRGIENLFFPSLEHLELYMMENLKGWWNEVIKADASNDEEQHDHHLSSIQFLKLSTLIITECPNLILMPLCPNLERLRLGKTNRNLSVVKKAPILSTTSLFPWSSRLRTLQIDDAEDLISLSQLGLGSLTKLVLEDRKLESTERLGEVFATLSSSLLSLQFNWCYKLRSISKGLEHLTALEELKFCECGELEVLSSTTKGDESEEDMMPWTTLKSTLRSLEFWDLPNVRSLPSGIQHFTNLHQLKLEFMKELREVPEWIGSLSSLQSLTLQSCPKLTYLPQSFQHLTSLDTLYIWGCDGLTNRCQKPHGADWPNIRHIPSVGLF